MKFMFKAAVVVLVLACVISEKAVAGPFEVAGQKKRRSAARCRR
jgi:hypothetical protein